MRKSENMKSAINGKFQFQNKFLIRKLIEVLIKAWNFESSFKLKIIKIEAFRLANALKSRQNFWMKAFSAHLCLIYAYFYVLKVSLSFKALKALWILESSL